MARQLAPRRCRKLENSRPVSPSPTRRAVAVVISCAPCPLPVARARSRFARATWSGSRRRTRRNVDNGYAMETGIVGLWCQRNRRPATWVARRWSHAPGARRYPAVTSAYTYVPIASWWNPPPNASRSWAILLRRTIITVVRGIRHEGETFVVTVIYFPLRRALIIHALKTLLHYVLLVCASQLNTLYSRCSPRILVSFIIILLLANGPALFPPSRLRSPWRYRRYSRD